MNKWMLMGVGFLLLAWTPFLYSEFTSKPVEKKGRDLPSADLDDDDEFLAAIEPEEEEEAEGEPTEDEPADEGEEPGEGEQAEGEPAEAEGVEGAEPGEAEEAEQREPEEGSEGEDGEPSDAPAAPPPPPPQLTGPTRVLKAAHDNEHRDALWADGAEARIAAMFDDDELPEGFFDSVSCRKAVCRIELRWSADQSEAYLKAHSLIREEFGTEVGVEPAGAAEEEGFQRINLYVPRQGYTVADLSE